MTISYTSKVSKSGLGSFVRVLFLWKGSIYKLVYKELLIFITLYYIINLFYRFVLNDYHRATFEQIVLYCDTFVNLIPLPFVLGFFVSLIVGRWWSQFQAIPFPDELMIYVNSLLLGKDEKSRLIRRTLMRYLNLASLLIFRSISSPVKKRFPDMESLVEAGFMTFKELKIYENISTPHSKWWIPCVWFANLITRAHNEKRLVDEFSLRTILLALMDFRGKCSSLYAYDWISVPLVYTQVVTLANYMYFIANLMGRQILDPAKRYSNRFDIYLPIFTFLQFLFYMGWLKVAEQLMNPFGEDEDDFEVNWIIDRNFQISMLSVDEMHYTFPDLEKDIYWDELEPDIPYTEASKYYKKNSWMGSTADLHLTREDVNEIHKDWMSTENIKGLNPFSNFHDTLHRLSSGSIVRSRKSNHSIKSDSRDVATSFKTPVGDDDYFSPNHAPTHRSSFSHIPRFGSHSLLSPIREQRFEVTPISDDSVIDSSAPNGGIGGLKNSSVPKDKLPEDQLLNNNLPYPDFERRKKMSNSDNNSTITENDLTVKGNIGNLAKFHNRKIREKMLKSAAGYVSEDFGNADTPYAKRPLGQSKSCPKGYKTDSVSPWLERKGLIKDNKSGIGKRFCANGLFKRKKFTNVNGLKENVPSLKIQGMSPKRGVHGGSSRRLRRQANVSDGQTQQLLATSFIPIQREPHLWNRNTSFKRASISSELKSWIFHPTLNPQLPSPDKALLVQIEPNVSPSIEPTPKKGPQDVLVNHSIRSNGAGPKSPKLASYRRYFSLPQGGKLMEEDEADLTTHSQISNEATVIKSGSKNFIKDDSRTNVIDLFLPNQPKDINNNALPTSSSQGSPSLSMRAKVTTGNYEGPYGIIAESCEGRNKGSLESSTLNEVRDSKNPCSFIEITLV